jgi:molybdopterin-containing oxidoreductase family iron-sulfur binding subunit
MNDDKRFWRSLAEFENPAGPSETPEFNTPLDPPTTAERRTFLKLTGATVALASATACRYPEDKLLPFTQQPEGVIPGVPRYFMTAMELRGAAVGLKVKSFDGRPIKIDGNPSHPDSLGATSAQHQAALLELYDPDRSRAFAKGNAQSESNEIEFRTFALDHFKALRAQQGRGLVVLSGWSSSPSAADMRTRWQARFPEAKWYEYEPGSTDNERLGSQLAFGAAYRSHLRLDKASVIVSLDADLLGGRADSLAVARGWSKGRDPAAPMNRMYVFESSLSETGSGADHRFAIRAEHIKAVAAFLDSELSRRASGASLSGAAQPKPAAKFLEEPQLQKILAAAVSDLLENRGKSIVVAGAAQPPEVHAIVHRINALLGNVGTTVQHTAVRGAIDLGSADSLANLVLEMSSGRVETLLVLDSNPVYTSPGDVDFAGALGKVKTKIHTGLYRDETAQRCDWHVPLAHFLEAWGDVRASDGTISIQQPVIAPLYGGKSAIELLAILSGDAVSAGQEIVSRALGDQARDPRLWRKAIHDGVLPNSAWAIETPVLRGLEPVAFTPGELSGLDVEPEQLELVLAPDPKLYDGRFANNGWLQELPDQATKLTWDNALLVSPKTAKVLGVTDQMLVTVSVEGRSLSVPALLSPGQAAGSVKLYLGYGRTAAGRVGGIKGGKFGWDDDVGTIGVNAYPLRSKNLWSFGRGATVKISSNRFKLATTQDKHTMDRIGKFGTEERLPMLVRQANLKEYKAEPDFAKHVVHHPPLLSLWKEPVEYTGPKWAMSIDLNKCTGCSGCVVACQAENNIPVVGKERVAMGREMQWLRIDRYFEGEDPDQPETAHQPIPCMHCEHAPCEQVCPVGATMHSHDGLNDMTYNRCIGTRYCSNNCPYKVRKFNYFNFHEELKEERNQVKEMAFNPDVTVRFRGVMEKCTYCVQRIRETTARASRENRPMKADEVTTACQDSCPTQAIIFGDAANPQSEVAARKGDSRDYSLLEELNVRPRTTYLARVKNPHPELG